LLNIVKQPAVLNPIYGLKAKKRTSVSNAVCPKEKDDGDVGEEEEEEGVTVAIKESCLRCCCC